MIFLDTSAALAFVNAKDDYHSRSVETLDGILTDGDKLITHNYVISETVALLQRRVGLSSAIAFARDAQDHSRIHWVSEADHQDAVRRWAERGTRRLNLVDCVSFVVMEMYECDTAFSYDSDFETEGFRLVG